MEWYNSVDGIKSRYLTIIELFKRIILGVIDC